VNLPSSVEVALRESLGAAPTRSTPLGGGMICKAAKVDTDRGPFFAKWMPLAPPGFFAVHLNHSGESYWPDVRSACLACPE